ncbi:hypothetical protein CAP35_13195 [Chitinophagaceae bacterium IBVUCB1]|nr:hypothetical protein CAP35_13195 [Chitinophagaceae bacterium IBVUCB1]
MIRINSFKYLAVLCLIFTLPVSSFSAFNVGKENSNQLYFIENTGQILNQYHQKRNDILFALKAGDMNIFIGANEIHYQWNRHVNDTSISSYRLDAVLIGANKTPQVIVEDKQQYCENYHFEDYDVHSTAYTYKTVKIKNIYPNIDWVLYCKNNMLKYDFIVRKGGDASNIKIQYKGATSIAFDKGEIIVETPYGSIKEEAPYTYDITSRKEIKSAFVLNENMLGFDIKKGEENLVIDPAVLWSTYFGGNQTDYGNCVTTDNDGNVYLGGDTYSTAGIATTGAHITTYPGASCGYIVKFNAAGARLWGTYFVFTGSTTTTINKIVTDNNGTIYGCGGAISGSLGNIGIFSFTSTGSYKWQSVYGASTVDEGPVDISYFGGKIYVVGYVRAATNFITTGSHQTTYGINTDGFILKRDTNATGGINWATYYGGFGTEEAIGCAFDKAGYLYVVGYTTSNTNIATTGAHQSVWSSGLDAFLVKFDTSGSRIWGTYYGGSSVEYGNSVAVDSGNNVYICGLTLSNNAIATSGAYRTYRGDGYIVKFNSNGIRQWGTYVESPLYSIVIGKDDTLYCAGNTSSTTEIATSGAFKPSFSGGIGSDAFVHAYNLSGNNLIWGSYFGGSNDEYVRDMAYQNATVYIAGNTQSSSGIATPGAFRTSINLNTPDAFLANIIIDTFVAIRSALASTCNGLDITIPYITNTSFLSGNTFTVQLSNTLGSFSSPINIGTVSATNAGNITCNIPSSTAPGSGYRIRIVSTNPVRISSDNGHNITINATPAKPIAMSNTPVCTGDTLSLSASTSTSGVSYSWSGPSSFSSTTQNPSLSSIGTSQAGDYIVTVIVNGCSAGDTETVVVKPLVVSNVTVSATPSTNVGPWVTIQFNSVVTNAGINAKYQWKKNGINIPGATSITYTGTTNVDFKAADTICVFVTTDTACAPSIISSCADAIKINVGVVNSSIEDVINIYPNPFYDVVTIRGITKGSSLCMYDIMGRKVFSCVSPTNPYIIYTADMKVGMYFIVLTSEDGDRHEYKLLKHN